ncbi:MAG TPA: ferrochelatase [Acidobacteriaceae bacterium]|jgi:ferrochelatase|nr:ferrochelatase [Acidobacteriaceae bacterium]
MRAVLLLAHGTPNTLGEMAEYLGKVTGGRALPRNVVEELQHRYAEIGLGETPGIEPPPLTKWTLKQAELLRAVLQVPVYVGMRNWHPYIAGTVARMKADGVSSARVICLAPQTSRTSIGLYKKALLDAVGDAFAVDFVEGWAAQPQLIAAFADRLKTAWLNACREAGQELPVLFTAHSVPLRTVEGDAPDPYAVEARHTAELVAAQLPEIRKHLFAFQSQGVAGGPWIGPTVEETLTALKQQGQSGVVIQPIGFVCDHVEVLYDIDVAFQQTARELGLKLWRAESLNDSPLLTQALVALAK